MKGRAARVVLLAGCGRPGLPTATRTLVGARRPWPIVSAPNQWGGWEKGRFPAFRGLKRGGERRGAAPRQPQSRGIAQIWKGLGQRVRLSVKAKVGGAAAGAWKVNFCRRAVKKMKSSVLASCSPGQARLPGKGAKVKPTESRGSFNHISGSSRVCRLAQAAGAFLPRKVRWQCSPTHFAETFPRSLLLSKPQWLFG